ncbi:MAG: hypothetical protein GXP52_04370 [Deltaproteobacteria bacterium]|nr:hypothetical protein [Deltaproteobacteria bacterium]
MKLNEIYLSVILGAFMLLSLGSLSVAAPSPLPGKEPGTFLTDFNFSGGTGDGYILYQVRWGDHRSFERVVVEFRERDTGAQIPELPRMEVEKDEYPARVAIRLAGVPTRAKEIYTVRHPFSKSRMLSGLNLFDSCGGGQFLTLVPSRPLEYRIFTILHPARLVIDVRPTKTVPSDKVRYFLRTFPLYGDQVCAFKKAALKEGITGRLLTDASGNTFGEAGVFDRPEDAFGAKTRLRELGKRFSLVVKARGIMETPEVLP